MIQINAEELEGDSNNENRYPITVQEVIMNRIGAAIVNALVDERDIVALDSHNIE